MKKMSEGITRTDLEKIYKENNTEDAAKKLGISVSCLYETIKRHNIPLKGRGGFKKRKLWIIS